LLTIALVFCEKGAFSVFVGYMQEIKNSEPMLSLRIRTQHAQSVKYKPFSHTPMPIWAGPFCRCSFNLYL